LVRIYLSTFKWEEKTLPMSFVIDIKGFQTKWYFGANSSHLVKACEIGQMMTRTCSKTTHATQTT